jgi:hypothetical protein
MEVVARGMGAPAELGGDVTPSFSRLNAASARCDQPGQLLSLPDATFRRLNFVRDGQ